MRKSIYFLLAFFSLVGCFTSCMKDDETDYSSYNECSITAFAIQDIEWTDTVPDQYGEDSTYTITVTGTDYTFTIDQEKGLIYNTDSLPKGTPVTKVLLSITADGNPIYHHRDDSDTWYSLSSDSVDFTEPVTATIYSYSENYSKNYTIKLNVHQQDADSTQWNTQDGAWVGKSLKTPKAVTFGDKVAVFGLENGKLMVTTATQGKMDWTKPAQVSGASDGAAYDDIICYQNTLYMIDSEKLMASDDGVNWFQIQTNTPITHLLGCNSSQLFGVSQNTFFTSTDGTSWNTESTEYPELIPDSNIFSYYVPYSTNSNLERTVCFGQIKESTDTIASAWYRDNGSQIGYSNLWGYTYTSRDNDYALPNLNNLVVLYYKEYLMAFGNDCRNKGYARAFDQLYVSKDWGITWKGQDDEDYDTYLALPTSLYRNTHEFAAYVDKDYNLWILMSETGDTWCGYLNRMKFSK